MKREDRILFVICWQADLLPVVSHELIIKDIIEAAEIRTKLFFVCMAFILS